VAPASFTPNDDGRKDTTKASWKLSDDAEVTLHVFKRTAYLGSFYVDTPLTAGKHSRVWNGIKPNGKKAAAGIYKFKLTAVGPGGTFKKTARVTLRR
jgi:hypothetical protein